jgi:hypothetical protein
VVACRGTGWVRGTVKRREVDVCAAGHVGRGVGGVGWVFAGLKWNLDVCSIQPFALEWCGSARNLVTNSTFAQRPRTTVETGSRDLPVGHVQTAVSSPSGKRNSEPDHKAVPVLLDVVLEWHLIGSATSSLVWHVRRERS